MAKIYISSTFDDLQNERQAAAQAIRRLGHQPIAMEDYVAANERPVDKCRADVRNCDAYVGLFAWRYGYIPDDSDKSITHLEYEAAQMAGIPRLVFLLDEKALWPVNYVAGGRERKKIEKLRDELKNRHIVSFFKNAAELGSLISAVLSKEFPPPISTAPSGAKPKLGPLVSKMCNRFPQENGFKEFFEEQSKKCPKRPQFYFIHGDEWEGHECFLERLWKTYLKGYAESKWGKEYATITIDEVPWPKEGTLPDRQQYLKRTIMGTFAGYRETPDLTVNTLAHLPHFEKRPLALIKHNVYSSKWDNDTLPLLSWYIDEYWAALECDEHEPIPRFLVFFNVKYEKPVSFFKWKIFGKERIREQLRQLCRSTTEKCPRQMLAELTPIDSVDVKDWFSRYHIFANEWESQNIIDAIFKENNSTRSWANVQQALSKVIEEYGYQREELRI